MGALCKLLWLLVIYCVGASAEIAGRWDNINHYLGQIDFAGAPALIVDFSTLDDSVKQIEIPLFGPFKFTIGQLISSGTVNVSNVECKNITLDDLTLAVAPNQVNVATTSVEIVLKLTNLHLDCTGKIGLSDVKLGSILPQAVVDWLPSLTTAVNFEFDAAQKDDADAAGLGADMVLNFTSPDFDLRPPSEVNVAGCALTIPADAIHIIGSKIATLLVPLLIGTVQSAACAVLTGLAGPSGYLNQELLRLEETIDAAGSTPRPNPVANEEIAVATLGPIATKDAANFASSTPVRLLSVFVDDVFGSAGDAPYQNDLVVNEFIRSETTATAAAVKLAPEVVIDVTTALAAGNMTIHALTIYGLDTFRNFSLLDDPGDELRFTLLQNLALDTVRLEVNATVELIPGKYVVAGGQPKPLAINFNATLYLKSPSIGAASLVMVNTSAISDLVVRQLLPRSLGGDGHAIDCLSLSTLLANLTDLEASLDDFDASLSGFLDPGFDDLISTAVHAAELLFRPSLRLNLPGLARGAIRNLLNDLLKTELARPDRLCYPNSEEQIGTSLQGSDQGASTGLHSPDNGVESSSFFDFNSEVYRRLLEMLDRTIFDVGSPLLGMNRVIRKMSGGFGFDSGTFALIDLLDVNLNLDSITGGAMSGTIRAAVEAMKFEHMDSFTQFQILQPVNDATPQYTIDNNITVGIPQDIVVSSSVNIGVDAFGAHINDTLALRLSLEQLQIALRLFLQLDLGSAKVMKLRQLLHGSCLASLAHHVSPLWLMLSLNRTNIGLDCAPGKICTSPGLAALSSAMNSSAGELELSHLISEALQWTSSFLQKPDTEQLVQNAIDSALKSMPAMCAAAAGPGEPPHRQAKSKKSKADDLQAWFKIILFSYLGGLLVVMLSVGFGMYFARRSRNGMRGTGSEAGETVQTTPCKSLFCSSGVSPWLQWAVPFTCISSVAVFVSGHLAIGASVDLYLDVLGDSVKITNLFEFTLAGSVSDMLNAGVYPLAFLIGVFSGVWPYLKLYMIAWCWFVPPVVMSPHRRGQLLVAIDHLGKWSFIDMYVLMLMMVAFRMHISAPETWEAFFPAGTVVADVVVTPGWGIYGFIIAASASLALNNVVIVAHRNAEVIDRNVPKSATEECTPEDPQPSKLHRESWFESGTKFIPGVSTRSRAETIQLTERRESVMSHEYHIVEHREHRLRLSLLGKSFGTTLLIVAAALTTAGAIIPTFVFKFNGLVKLVLPSEAEYSVISVAVKMGEQKDFPGQSPVGLVSMQIIYLLFVLIIPLIQLVMLAVLWTVPLTIREQKIIFYVNEVLNAWSSLEVFLVSVLGALLEISQYAAFIVGDVCDPYRPLIGVFMGSEEDASCFDVHATLVVGCATLVLASVLNICVGQLVVRCAESAIEDRVNDVLGEAEETSEGKDLDETLTCEKCGTCWCSSREKGDQNAVHQFLVAAHFLRVEGYGSSSRALLNSPLSSPTVPSQALDWGSGSKNISDKSSINNNNATPDDMRYA